MKVITFIITLHFSLRVASRIHYYAKMYGHFTHTLHKVNSISNPSVILYFITLLRTIFIQSLVKNRNQKIDCLM